MLNRDKQLLRIYYEFKHTGGGQFNNPNTSGDSGVSSEFMYTSHSSSNPASNTCSMSSNISLSHQNNNTQPTSTQLCELTSLANVSIFEHDEYFSYFIKLVQQFQIVDFQIRLNSTNTPATAIVNTAPGQIQASKLASSASFQSATTNVPKIQAYHHQPNSSGGSTTSNGSTSAFNLKNISKRLNIKSWFTSSSSMVHSPSSLPRGSRATNHSPSPAPPQHAQHSKHHHPTLKAATRLTNFTQQHKHKMAAAERAGQLTTGMGCVVDSKQKVSNLTNTKNNSHQATNDLMKHSLSEPSLNSIININ